MDFTWLGIGPPTWEPGPANLNFFSHTKGLCYRQKYSSESPLAPLWWPRRWGSRRAWLNGVVKHGLRLWGRLDVLPNSLNQCWRWLMVERLTFNYLATALVEIPAVSIPIARSLKTWDICGIVLCWSMVVAASCCGDVFLRQGLGD